MNIQALFEARDLMDDYAKESSLLYNLQGKLSVEHKMQYALKKATEQDCIDFIAIITLRQEAIVKEIVNRIESI